MGLFKGLGIAMVTPFDDGWKEISARLLDWYDGNADALIVLGTTGEASTMTDVEKTNFVKFIRAKTSLPLIVGAGSNSTAKAADNIKMFADLGADAALVVTPYYNKCTQEGLLCHYARLLDEGLPIIAYNVPARTGMNLEPQTAKKLASMKNFAGIKEASGNFTQLMEVIRLTEGKTDVFCGDDDLAVPAILMGAKGVISVTANVAPSIVHKAVHAALRGENETAAFFRNLLAPLTRQLFSEVNPIPVKAALNALGIFVGSPRLPLTDMSPDKRDDLLDAMRELKLL